MQPWLPLRKLLLLRLWLMHWQMQLRCQRARAMRSRQRRKMLRLLCTTSIEHRQLYKKAK